MDEDFIIDAIDVASSVPVQPKKEGLLKRIWNKTIFADIIRDKKEEREMKRKVKKEAKREAIEESKDDLKNIYKEKIIAKARGKEKGEGKTFGEKLSKFGKMFETGGMFSDEKMDKMLGGTGQRASKSYGQSGSPIDDEKLSRMLGGGKKESAVKTKRKATVEKESTEDKINRVLYG